MSWECRYCDRPEGLYGIPITIGDEEICACGAEWADAKIWVDFDEDEYVLLSDEYADQTYGSLAIEDDVYECGCRRDDGCYCNFKEDDLDE